MICAYFLIATFYLCAPVVFIAHDELTSKEVSIMTHFPFHQQLSSRPIRHKAGHFPMSPLCIKRLVRRTVEHGSEEAA